MVLVGTVLAGGHSSRMGGGNKFQLEIGGVSLIDRVRRRLAPQVDCLVASVAQNSHLYELGMVTIADRAADRGPLGGMEAVFGWCSGVFSDALVVTVPADTPFIPLDLVGRLQSARAEKETDIAIAASASGVHHAIGLWPAALAETISEWLTNPKHRAIKDFLKGQTHAIARFVDEPDPFFNINTPDDLIEGVRRAGGDLS